MHRHLFTLFALLLSSLLPAAQTAEQSECGKIESVRGPAVVIRDRKVTDAKAGDALRINDVLQTGAGGRMRISLKDGSSLSLGQRGELRVVRHDVTTQVTIIEMLRGRVRASVNPITKAGGNFEIHTPTARVRAVGTVISVSSPEVDTTSSLSGTVIDQKAIDDLPMNGRDFRSLLQLEPGIPSGKSSGPSLWNFDGVKETGVTVEDHYGSVMNIDPQISGQVDLMPGQFTIIPKGQPPKPAQPMYAPGGYSPEYLKFRLDFQPRYNFDRTATSPGVTPPQNNSQSQNPNRNPACGQGYILNGVWTPQAGQTTNASVSTTPPAFRTEITGTGISTGNAIQVKFYNDSPCPLKFVVTNGTLLRPTGFVGRVIEGLLLGNQPLKDYQIVITVGGKVYLRPLAAPSTLGEDEMDSPEQESFGGPSGSVAFDAPVAAGSEATMMLRSYCVELHKLAPHPKTYYKFAEEPIQQKYAAERPLVDRAYHMLLTRQITLPPGQSLDSLVQWMLWLYIERMNHKQFHDEFFTLVKHNYEVQKKKWDKNAEKEVERMEEDLWNNAQKVINAK